MILTCPECATSYFVDDARIPPQGRRVRCSSCAHRWLAGPNGPLPEPGLEPEPAPEFESVAEPAPPEEEDDVVVAPLAPEPEPYRPAFRPLPPPPPPKRSGALIWAGAAGLVVALIAGLIVFREQVVRLWPASSAAYAGLGFEVAGGGLVLEQVRVRPAYLAGRPVLSISGAIHNVRGAPIETPPLRLTLLDRSGRPVAAKIARPDDATIPGRARKQFTVTMLDPPSTARDLEVRFDGSAGGRVAVRPAQAVLAPAPTLPSAAATTPAVTAPSGPVPAEAGPSPGERGQLTPAEATEHG